MIPRRQGGFTLVELMISLVIFSFAVAGILSVAVTISNGVLEQRQVVAMQDAARAAVDFIADCVRAASPGVSTGSIQHVNTCATGAVQVTNSTTGPDQLTVVFASAAVVTSTRSLYTTGSTSVTLTDASQISAGDTLLLTDLSQGHLVLVTAVDATIGVAMLQPQSCASLALPGAGYPGGSLVIRVQRARFYIDTIDDTPTLMMDPDAEGPASSEPLAEGVEDLQVAIGVDADDDGNITAAGAAADDDELVGNIAGDRSLSGTIRSARIDIVARSRSPLRGGAPGFLRPAVEDHAASATGDAYRRRVLSTEVRLRNRGGSR